MDEVVLLVRVEFLPIISNIKERSLKILFKWSDEKQLGDNPKGRYRHFQGAQMRINKLANLNYRKMQSTWEYYFI